MDEDFAIPIPGSKYGEIIIINEYKGQYSLVLGRETEEKTYMQWVFPQGKDRQPAEKAIPLKIPLGNRDDAVETVRQIAIAFGLSIEGNDGAF